MKFNFDELNDWIRKMNWLTSFHFQTSKSKSFNRSLAKVKVRRVGVSANGGKNSTAPVRQQVIGKIKMTHKQNLLRE